MTYLPKRSKRPKMNVRVSSVLRVPSFLKFVRNHVCAVSMANGFGELDCEGPIEAAHVRHGTDGGTGMKPSDRYALPLCSGHHRRQHAIGELPFEHDYRVDMRKTADAMWAAWLKTDTGRRWMLKTGYQP